MNINTLITLIKYTKPKTVLWDVANDLGFKICERDQSTVTIDEIKASILKELEEYRNTAVAGGSEPNSVVFIPHKDIPQKPILPPQPTSSSSASLTDAANVSELDQEPEQDSYAKMREYDEEQWLEWWIERALNSFCEGYRITKEQLKEMVRETYTETTFNYVVEEGIHEALGENLTKWTEWNPRQQREIMAKLSMRVRQVIVDWFEQMGRNENDIRGAKLLQKETRVDRRGRETGDVRNTQSYSREESISSSPSETEPAAKRRKSDRPAIFSLPTPSATTKGKSRRIYDTEKGDESPFELHTRPLRDSPTSLILEMKKQSFAVKQAELDSKITTLQVPRLTVELAKKNGFPRWYLDFYNEGKAHAFNDRRLLTHLLHPDYVEKRVFGDWYAQMPARDRTLPKILDKLNTIYPGMGSTFDDIRKFEEYKMRDKQLFADYDAKKKSLYEKAYPVPIEKMFEDDGVTHDVTKDSVFLIQWKHGLQRNYLKSIAEKEPSFMADHGRPMNYEEMAKKVRDKELSVNSCARYDVSTPETKSHKKGVKRNRNERSPDTSSIQTGPRHHERKEQISSERKNHFAKRCTMAHTDSSVKPHPYHACVDPKIECLNCKGKGHMRFRCPRATCTICKRNGHTTKAHSWSRTKIEDF